MHTVKIFVRLFLGIIVNCVLASAGGFTYPYVTDISNTTSNGTANATTSDVFNVSIHRSDVMIIEYTGFPFVPFLSIAMYCYDTVALALADQKSGPEYGEYTYSTSTLENTGAVKWNFTNSDYGSTDTPQQCRFMLFNSSLAQCTWDPWNVVTNSYYGPNTQTPFSFSAIFELLAENNTAPSKVWKADDDGLKASKTADMKDMTTATCPPSGLPAQPIPTHWQVDDWPSYGDDLQWPL